MHVHLNCACTLDGRIGAPGRTPLAISNKEDLQRVHQLRGSSDAILVGVGTVLADDPKLTVKWDLVGRPGREPLRVVLDSRLRTPSSALVRNSAASTLFFAAPDAPIEPNGVTVERVQRGPDGGLDLSHVLAALEKRGIRRLLVEGGEQVLTSFLRQDRVDSATIFVAPRIVGGENAPRIATPPTDLAHHLRLERAGALGEGILVNFVRR